jgi:hypothetical protein
MKLELEINPALAALLVALNRTGLFGARVEETAERLMADAIAHRMNGPLANELRDAMARERARAPQETTPK